MNARTALVLSGLLGWIAFGPCPTYAQSPEESFLTDYSKLQPAPDNPFDESYVAADLKVASKYTAVMIDQPELFIHPDSPYKGIKPDDMKAIADELRGRVIGELKSGYQIVDQPGPNVMYVRLAVGDLVMEKKKRPILAYTPVGAVVHAVKNVTSKIDLKNMKIEGEVLDSTSLEQLGAVTTSRGSLSSATIDPTKQVTWQELDHVFSAIGKRLRCRLDNSHKPDSQQENCGAIGLAPAVTAASEQ